MNSSTKVKRGSVITAPRVRVFRVARNFRQVDLAKLAGLTPETISNIERGAVVPARKSRESIASALGVDAEQLWPEVGDG